MRRFTGNAGRRAALAERAQQLRQGIRGHRFNCKHDDGLRIPYSLRNELLESSRIHAFGALHQRVRSSELAGRAEFQRNAVVGQSLDEACLQRLGGRCVDAQRSGPFHDECIVSRVSQSFPARVVSVGKNAAWVVLDSEDHPRIAALKRTESGVKREMLAPGDRVEVLLLEDGRVLVTTILARTFTLRRRTVEGRAKTMAANVDAMVTVTALAEPAPRLLTLDQLLAFAELEDIGALVVFTKPDLASAENARALHDLYRSLGYAVIIVNAKSGERIEELRAAIEGRQALLCGVSGVGKSSIFRALGGQAVVGEVSRFGTGRQTTTAARLYRMPAGFLIDSPGVAEFGLGAIAPAELAGAFREMREAARSCRFSDCSHLHEPGCAVQAAVEQGRIAASRYTSFRRILESPA